MKAKLKRGKFPLEHVKINIGGSKSESNRLLILQAQFPNITIQNLSESDDTIALKKGLKIKNGTVDVHHAGTAMRFLTAYYSACQNYKITLTGSTRMRERPIGILVEALQFMGANIAYCKQEGFPPLMIEGKNLTTNQVTLKANVSSQYISALMLVAPMFPDGLQIYLEGKVTSVPYIEMTLSLLKSIGVKSSFTENTIVISAAKDVESNTIVVESDWSSASYFYSLVALSENCQITLGSFIEDSLQGDKALVQIYEALGVKTVFNAFERTISLSKTNNKLPKTIQFNLSNTPDIAQTIAVTCFGLGIGCKLTGLHTLKIKETDRLQALKTELEKLGATLQIDDSSLVLEKAARINTNVIIETYQDHRMAMAFAPLAVKTPLEINNPEVVSKSYPNFWKDLKLAGINCFLSDFSE
ncbi:3-phosphoshikimate 1-carboxyvinyltransferase [Aequorivita marisscotiae]|uniref:3-phosphoshikimate 1-carboxyvinyltransferase n=1 Tax=Aequorivita marisscotiae TaxID=3040348 RepID=A0ABY8KUX7_9FLAO|nr:3-phosphoshikimate 1-carboxyvinyltransferase [Aequorivita sp. Ant34-E75]WGF92867.1 3-phosphoshikimate 1-carboxyvinyltransferase [Aequorivita sp. Ant34-E75]